MLRTLSLRPCTRLSIPNSNRCCNYATYSDAIHAKNKNANALVFVAGDGSSKTKRGPLNDVPTAVKDNICTKSMPTTCSSEMLREFVSPFDATVVELLEKAGTPIVGKANCDEFGMGSLNTHSVHGPVVNPYQPPLSNVPWKERERRSAGGSSGGSAAAVAAGMCQAALGTDTGGSIRLPASYCGIVGLKPSYGIVSRWGVISYADSLDCVGVLGTDVAVTRRVFHVVSQHDHKDPSTAPPETRQNAVSAMLGFGELRYSPADLSTLCIGIPQEYFPSELSQTIVEPLRKVIEALKRRGATVVPVSLPSTRYALSAYYVIASAEASSNLARYDGIEYGLRVNPPQGANTTKTANVYAHTRSKGFGREVQRRILLGTYALTADAFDNYFLQAQRVRKAVRADFDRVFRVQNVLHGDSQGTEGGVDVLLHPSAIQTAPFLEDAGASSAEKSLNAYVQDVLTVPASLAGLPALSLPVGLAADSWPVGASIVGQWGCDEMVLRVGSVIEQVISDENTASRQEPSSTK